MSDLVITGATGFVGQRLVKKALDQEHRVEAWVRSPEKLEELKSSNLEIIQWRANGEEAMASRLESVDAVVHLAAYLPPSYGDQNQAEECFRVNALGTLELLEACSEADVDKFVFTSSGNVYTPGHESVDENSPTYPSWRAPYYLTSKLSGEVFVDHFRRSDALESTVILRPPAIYGPGMKGGVVPLFAQRLLAGEPIQVNDGGRHRVDLVFVDDVVDAILAAVARDVSGPFNIGSGTRPSILELAQSLVSICDVPEDLVEVEPASDGDEGDSTGFSGLDIQRARRELDYDPRSLEEGLRRYVDSLRE